MKFNKLTMGLAAVGVVSLASAARAEETQMDKVNTALTHTTLSGYVDTSAVWNLGSQNGSDMIPTGYQRADGFNLNAVDITLDKPLDESPWAAGYHVELMWGPDAIPADTGTFGPGALTANIRQAYIALRTPVGNSGIDWKVGVWDTIIGYESSSDPLNPNYTRSLGWSVEPTTHTGILGTYKVNDMVSVTAGIANGSFIAAPELPSFGVNPVNGRAAMESQKAYMGAVAFTAPDNWGWMKGATMNVGIINAIDTKGSGFGGTAGGTTSFYVGATIPTPMNALKVGAAFDYMDHHDAHRVPGANTDSSVWVAGLYANFQANDKLSFNVRGEHMEFNTPAFFGHADLDEFTATAQYALWANVLSRVEFRWDHIEHGTAFDDSPYGEYTGIHDNAYMLALNLIYQF